MPRVPITDIVLAALAAAVTAIEVSTITRLGATWYAVANLLIHIGLTGALLVRHVWRRGSFITSYVLLAALALVVLRAPSNLGVSPLVACAPLSLYVVARHESYRWAVTGLLVGVAGAFVSPFRRLPDGSGGTAWIPVMVLVLLGTFLWATGRRRAELAYEQRLIAELADRERTLTSTIAQAQAGERARIARELHDIVAHSLAVVQVQASTGLSIGSSARMRESLANVRDASKAALMEVRALVQLMREESPTFVAGDLAQIRALVQEARAAGVALDVQLPDDETLQRWQARWPAQTRLTVIRVLQESLTNILKHGGPDACAQLTLHSAASRVRIHVTNDHATPGASPGYGLAGLRERVTLAGGVFHAGPDSTGFTVDVDIPIPAEES